MNHIGDLDKAKNNNKKEEKEEKEEKEPTLKNKKNSKSISYYLSKIQTKVPIKKRDSIVLLKQVK